MIVVGGGNAAGQAAISGAINQTCVHACKLTDWKTTCRGI